MLPESTDFLRLEAYATFQFHADNPPNFRLESVALDNRDYRLHRWWMIRPGNISPALHILAQYAADGSVDARRRMWTADDPRRFFAGSVGGRGVTSLPVAGFAPPDLRTLDQVEDDTTATTAPDGTARLYRPGFGTDGGLEVGAFPVMDSLSHLGRLPVSKDALWHTIPLVGRDAVDVARYFSITNALPSVQGRISLNSPYREVISAGFLKANAGMTGEHSNRSPLSRADALALADLIIKKRPASGYRSKVEVWRCAPLADWRAALGGRNKFEVEEIVMRSERLFTVRQQLFTVFLAAQIRNAGGETIGESRAMAVVWRDPFRTDEQGLIVEPGDAGYAEARHRVKMLVWRRLDS